MWSRSAAKLAGIVIVFMLVTTGCGLTVGASGTVEADPIRQAAMEGPAVTFSVADGSTVPPGTKVQLTAADGWTIRVISPEAGSVASGADGSGATSWSSKPLPPGQRMVVDVEATYLDGTQRRQQFTTTATAAKNTFRAEFSDSGKYGVGHMPTISFSMAIPRKYRKQVVGNIATTVTPKNVPVKYRWVDDQTLAYRPQKFWPGHSKITVKADLSALAIPDRGRTYWGKSTSGSWKTNRAMVIYIYGDEYWGKVTIDGKKVKTFPTSLGKYGYTTRSGIKTLTEKDYVRRMTNVGVTNDEVYDLQVPYTMRLTDTGEFLHGAPWNGNIGYANTSHGCSNLTTSDAFWIFSRMLWGDPVITTGTSRSMESWNGPGGLWNIAWKKWA